FSLCCEAPADTSQRRYFKVARMNEKNISLGGGFVKPAYVAAGAQYLNTRRNLVSALLANRRLPKPGWDDHEIEMLLFDLAAMDSNNSIENVGVGEREGRVYSQLVARRCYRLAHGVGRSGDIAEAQPKAAGSSLMVQILSALVLDALHVAGLKTVKACLVLPTSTGMSLALVLSALRRQRPNARRVLWPRMDQKSCLKAIVTAGFEPIIVPNRRDGDAVVTDVDALRRLLFLDNGNDESGSGGGDDTHGGDSGGGGSSNSGGSSSGDSSSGSTADDILCVITTASCFAPRLPDCVDQVAALCHAAGMPHVINNAYGLQCAATTKRIERAAAVGRVDAVVQSTDKNFLVPVGGSIICGYDRAFLEEIGQTYPGRASSAPNLDLFITLLSMGEDGYRRLLWERHELVDSFRARLAAAAAAHGERMLDTPGNSISFAMTLERLHQAGADAAIAAGADAAAATAAGGRATSFLGSMLFTRCVSGTRVVVPGAAGKKTVAGLPFAGYGASVDDYGSSYLTAACAIGLTRPEVEEV
ncbi:unnamed protein product, partial [Phaeothamnion confervicola]